MQILTVSKQLRAITLKFHRGQLIMAIFGHSSGASLRNYIGRPSNEQLRACSNILSDELSRRPHQPSVTVLSSRAIFRLLFVHKIHALSSLFSIGHVKKNQRVFMSDNLTGFTENFPFRLCMKTEKLQAKASNFTLRTVSDCEPL